MRTTTSQFALLALPAFALATVKLSDFAPRASDVQGACKTVYTQDITACSGSDFSGTAGCSEACIQGLAALTAPIQSACSSNPPSGQNIITVYLSGNGPQSLCGSAAAAAESSAAAALSSTAAQSGTSSSAAPSSSSAQSSVASSTPAPSSTSSGSVESSSVIASSTSSETSSSSMSSAAIVTSSGTSATSTTALVVDTSSMPTAASTSGTSTSSSSRSSQTSTNDHSGGGSPFDTDAQPYSAAPPQAASSPLALAIATCMLLVLFR